MAGLAFAAASLDWPAGVATAGLPPFEIKEVVAPGRLASKARLLVPAVDGERKIPLLVALHGAGESRQPAQGLRAWLELYGLSVAYQRLLAPPLKSTSKRQDWSKERLAEINASLKIRPFGPIAVLCPFTPSLQHLVDRAGALAEYATWLTEQLIPATREGVPAISSAASDITIDGYGTAGVTALAIAAAHPAAFGAVGLVQPTLDPMRVRRHAREIANMRSQNSDVDVQLLTSEDDPLVETTRALSRQLERLRVSHKLRVSLGPKDQAWLREVGAVEMLLFHERGRPSRDRA